MRKLKAVVSDYDLRDAVQEELDWDPQVGDSRIRVAVTDGAIVLSGSVESYAQKAAAVRAAERIHGVKAVADDIQVVQPDSVKHKDAEIAAEIARGRGWNTLFPDSIEVEVANGVVTLRGTVERRDQHEEAARAVRHLEGVRGVTNLIRLEPRNEATTVANVEHRIERALQRQADLDAKAISVTTADGVVRLEGTVASLAARRLAQLAAESAPGVTEVVNELDVS
jgi:osmotically-inducible protein OsmY